MTVKPLSVIFRAHIPENEYHAICEAISRTFERVTWVEAFRIWESRTRVEIAHPLYSGRTFAVVLEDVDLSKNLVEVGEIEL